MANTSIGGLSISLGVNSTSFNTGLSKAGKSLGAFATGINASTGAGGLGGMAMSLAGATGALGPLGLAVSAVGAIAGKSITSFAGFEQTETAFGVMLGSVEKAKEYLVDLQQFAAVTPFHFKDLTKGIQLMLAFGFSAEEARNALVPLGNLAAANPEGMAEGVERISRALGQIKSKGKLMAQEVNQLAEAGIPAWKAIADEVAGGDISKAMKMGEMGLINADKAIGAILKLGNSAKFSGMMEKQSKTVGGMWSTLVDNAETAMVKLGKFLMETLGLKRVIPLASKALEWIQFQFGLCWSVVTTTGQILYSVFQPFIDGAMATWSWVSGTLWPALSGFFVDMWALIRPILTTIVDGIAGVFYAFWSPIKMAFAPIIDFVSQQTGGIGEAFNSIIQFVRPVFMEIKFLAQTAFAILTEGARIIGYLLAEAFKALGAVAAPILGSIGTWFGTFAVDGKITITSIRDFFIDSMIAMEFIFLNFGRVSSAIWVDMQLGAVRTFNELVHLLTVQMPIALKWFADNWQDIFKTLWSFTKNLFLNIGENFSKFTSPLELAKLAAGQTTLEDMWTPLLDGFENTIKELPNFAAREIGELEAELQQQSDDLWGALANDFNEFRAMRREALDAPPTGGWKEWFDLMLKYGEVKPGAAAGGGLSALSTELPKAMLAGSADALSAINQARANAGAFDPVNQMVAKQEQAVGFFQKMLEELKRIAGAVEEPAFEEVDF